MLDLNLWLMLFIAVLFLALLYLLDTTLYRPLLKFMDERDDAITKDLEAAKNIGDNTQAIEEEAAAILSKAKSEASAIRQKAIEEAKKESEQKIAQKQRELEESYAKFLQELEGEKGALYNALLSQLPLFKESLKAKFTQL